MPNTLTFGNKSIKFRTGYSLDRDPYSKIELLFRDDIVEESWSLTEIIELGDLKEHFKYFNSNEFQLPNFPPRMSIEIDCGDAVFFKVLYADKVLKTFVDLDEAIEYIVGE